ncbi:transporter DMT superfamily protein [Alishewanella agri BL06]|uniref:Transporter DMT superfamily protein n=1 Tax=Alishewanella agri BL06 TaxID=1195246 RepID=I8U8J4_9ALTE|nr:transporter DMT superfamily protein [Alishewanella agri BL06]
MALTREQKLGGLFAASAYTLWGIAPLYFKQIDVIPAPEILLHRIVWSFLLLFIVLLLLKQGRETLAVLAKPKLLAGFCCVPCCWGVTGGYLYGR